MAIITLLSDFGLKDSYVAEMKGVIFTMAPQAKIVDITHQIDKYDILMGTFILASATRYFPHGSIHVAVVDPGVGGKRRPIMIKTKKNYYIGPDNGILVLAALNDGIEKVYHISKDIILKKEISATFHGRDIFAYTASKIANGLKPDSIGVEINDYLVPDFAQARISKNEINCEIIHIDDFGNLITNVNFNQLNNLGLHYGSNLSLRIGELNLDIKLLRTYSEARSNELLALIGSHNFLEISENLGSASKRIGAKKGDKLKFFVMN
ncbi:MAG: S-adenosyl-l-methionine hydroxide adenosyltransferase family protein [Candidatus Thorarchaeota archaeon]